MCRTARSCTRIRGFCRESPCAAVGTGCECGRGGRGGARTGWKQRAARPISVKRRLRGDQSAVALGSQRFTALHAEGRTQRDCRTEAEEPAWQSLDGFLSPSSPEAVPNADSVQPATFQKHRRGWWPAAQMEGQCRSGLSHVPRKFLRRSPDPRRPECGCRWRQASAEVISLKRGCRGGP